MQEIKNSLSHSWKVHKHENGDLFYLQTLIIIFVFRPRDLQMQGLHDQLEGTRQKSNCENRQKEAEA